MRTPEKKKRKKWTNEQMIAAMKFVEDGEGGVNQAAIMHGVPKSTLKDRLTGRVQHGSKPGPVPYFSNDEETEISTFLLKCSVMGYGKTRRDVLNIAEGYAIKKGIQLKKEHISDGWWRRFKERQDGKLVLRKGDNTSFLRMDAMNATTLKHYYDLLEDTLKEHNLFNSPSQLYNVDESGIPLDPKAPKVVTLRGTRKARYQSPGRKGQITIVACGNAAGQVIPPLIIFDAKNVRHAWTKDEVPGAMYGASEKGWINTELFDSWFDDLFLPSAVAARPLLLLLDGHSTHYQLDVITKAKKNDVLVLCLPPHTTHATQPLDCGVFSPLKAQWSATCHDFIQKHPGKAISKFNFNKLFSQAWLKSLIPANLIAGFKTCGIYPFDRNAVKAVPIFDTNGIEKVSKRTLETEMLSNESALDSQTTNTEVEFDAESGELFSAEQIQLFTRRFEEGYNLSIDPAYNRWLKQNHSEFSTTERSSFSDDIEPTVGTSSSFIGSIADEFSHIEPLVPLSIEQLSGTTQEPLIDNVDLSVEVVTSQHSSGKMICTNANNNRDISTRNPLTSPTVSIEATYANTGNISTPTSQHISSEMTPPSNSTTSAKRSLSDLLVGHTPQIIHNSASEKVLPKARLLTSAECLATLQEKEMKKKKALEEKEQKRKEREEKKKLREEELKRKAQERAKKAEEKAKKAEEKARRDEAKARNAAESRSTTRRKGKHSNINNADIAGPSCDKGNEHGEAETVSSMNTRLNPVINTSNASGRYTGAVKKILDESIDTDICCMCFTNYEDDVHDGNGTEWINCPCGRWLHLDCAEDCITDQSGNERYCPFCIDGLT